MTDVLDGTEGRIQQQIRMNGFTLLACRKCDGRAMTLVDGLCAACESDRLYRDHGK